MSIQMDFTLRTVKTLVLARNLLCVTNTMFEDMKHVMYYTSILLAWRNCERKCLNEKKREYHFPIYY